jgi:hypothetical protein
MKTIKVPLLLCFLLLAGCQSAGDGGSLDWLASLKPNAIKTAEARGQAELSCPGAKGAVLSAKEAPREYQGARFVTPQLGAFTVGVDGCGKRTSYLVVCERDLAKDCVISTPRP